jgi:hypothetical protein
MVDAHTAAAEGELLYDAPFDDPAAAAADFALPDGRTELDLGYGTARFQPGELAFDVHGNEQVVLEPDWGDGGLPNLPRDMAVEAEFGPMTGGRSRKVGVACRATGSKGAYHFIIGLAGLYSINRYDGVKAYGTGLVNPTKAKPFRVDPSKPNTIRAECRGTKRPELTLFVNGKRIVRVVDPKPPKPERAGTGASLVVESRRDERLRTAVRSFTVSAL